jgi:hypothetical protein
LSCVPCVASFSGLFLLCFSLSCVPYVASFSGLFNFDCPSDVYFSTDIVYCIKLMVN